MLMVLFAESSINIIYRIPHNCSTPANCSTPSDCSTPSNCSTPPLLGNSNLLNIQLVSSVFIFFYLKTLVGLSKERPILDHHPKVHIHEIRWISPEIHPKPYKIRCFNKNSSVWGGMHGGGYDPRFHEIQGHSPSPAFIKLNSFCWNIWIYKVLGGFHLKSGRFHVKSRDHLQRIVTLCFDINLANTMFIVHMNDGIYHLNQA